MCWVIIEERDGLNEKIMMPTQGVVFAGRVCKALEVFCWALGCFSWAPGSFWSALGFFC